MKKFIFTLQKVYQMKLNEQKDLKTQLQNIDKRISQVETQRKQLEGDIILERLRFQEQCKNGTQIHVLVGFDNYFTESGKQMKSYSQQLTVLNSQRLQKQQLIMRNLNEVKVLDRKRDEQYKAYCAEAKAAGNKEMDSFVSYQATRN